MRRLDPAAWTVVSPLFDRALDLDAAARRRFLDDLSVADPAAGRVLSRLLAAHERLLGSDFLEESPLADAEPDLAGTSIGAYTLDAPLGAGGMGVVWKAHRSDGRYEGAVALKLLQLAVLDGHTEGRFRLEGTLLARLSHPNIARLLDAGVTPAGQPYLVLEFVDGVSLDAFATAQRLALPARLGLMLQVCDAVAHAHAHLVLHRDLKPSNVLVDREGRVKLLDFGIGSWLRDEASRADLAPALTRAFTPEFAAPEQASGGEVTTATDVYAIGVMLERLIADPQRRRSDLDAVVRTATATNPMDRYPTVMALADDIRRYQRHEPVAARPGTWGYRARRFLRRQRVGASVAAVVGVGLLTGIGLVNRERRVAEHRFEQVRELANKLFDIDVQVRQLPGSTKTRQTIVDTALGYLKSLADDIDGDPRLALDVGTAYMRVARVQGVPISANLGQTDNAEATLLLAEHTMAAVLAEEPANRTATLRAAQIAHDRMILAGNGRAEGGALPLARQSATWLDRYLAAGAVPVSELDQVLITLNNVGNRFRIEHDYAEALRLTQRGIDLARGADGLVGRLQGGALLIGLTWIHRDRGALDDALAAIREARRLVEPQGSPAAWPVGQTNSVVLTLRTEGQILGQPRGPSLGRPHDAIAPLERGLGLIDALVHRDPADADVRGRLGGIGLQLADILSALDPARALAVYDHVLAHLAEIANNPRFRRDEVRALANSTRPLHALGRPADAERRLTAAFERLRALGLYPADQIELGSEADDALSALGDDQLARGRVGEAIATYQTLLDAGLAARPAPETDLADASAVSRVMSSLAALHASGGDRTRASALDDQRLRLWTAWDRRLPGHAFIGRQLAAARSGSAP